MPHTKSISISDRGPATRRILLVVLALCGYRAYSQTVELQLPGSLRTNAVGVVLDKLGQTPLTADFRPFNGAGVDSDSLDQAILASSNQAPNPAYALATPMAMSWSDKADFYVHRIGNVGSLLGPAIEAAAVMASPPKGYPSDWRQGAGGFGRNYGAVTGRAQTGEFTRFAAGLVLREDPRYYPSPNRNAFARVFHALLFTISDRSDSGQSRVAFANIAGATAGGFVGDTYLPSNYTDLRHAAVRTGFQFAAFAVRNVIDEFTPEVEKITNALKLRAHGGN